MIKVFETITGSYMWKMDKPDSDLDYFICYLAPTKEILNGTAKTNSYVKQEGNNDYAYHEVGKVVDELIKGNVNFLWGVMSPIIKSAYGDIPISDRMCPLLELKMIVQTNLAKNCYHSIHGLAKHNYEKYIASGKDTSKKRCNTIVRTLYFGINLLNLKRFIFEPIVKATPIDIREGLAFLDEAYEDSKLPEKPNENPYHDWLLALRLSDLGLSVHDV